MTARAVKFLLDRTAASLLFLLAMPVLGLTVILIWIEDRGPAMFRQTRVGKDRREFFLLKFRSMRVNELPLEAVGQVHGEHPLVTRVGRVIRRLKIDELPQLVNVVKGEMSLVGPRPTVREQVDRYDSFQLRRLAARPGLTGWPQINGGTAFTWPERIVLDVWYLDHWSLALDARILLGTLGTILQGERRNEAVLKQAIEHARQKYGYTVEGASLSANHP